MVWVGRDLLRSSTSNPLAVGRDIFHHTRWLKVPSNLVLNTSRDGESMITLVNLFHCLTILIVKSFFLKSQPTLYQFKAITLCLFFRGPKLCLFLKDTKQMFCQK